MDKPSPYFSNLKCRECGRLYPKEAIHVCDFDFGPLEAAYDYEAIGKQAALLASDLAARAPSAPPFAFAPGKVSVNVRTRDLFELRAKVPEGYVLIK